MKRNDDGGLSVMRIVHDATARISMAESTIYRPSLFEKRNQLRRYLINAAMPTTRNTTTKIQNSPMTHIMGPPNMLSEFIMIVIP
jgi:hypothetical protein